VDDCGSAERKPKMSKKKARARPLDAGKVERPAFVTDSGVKEDLRVVSRLRNHSQKNERSGSPRVSGGDLDATWDEIGGGEETVGGSAPTPDQSIVEMLGEAAGITYEDDESLHVVAKMEKRDRRRWELNPASAEDYKDRNR
jgi:hypothetical protein